MADTDATKKHNACGRPGTEGIGPQPDKGLSEQSDKNVDQDGHCITPAHAESATLNSGAPCDDGRGEKETAMSAKK